VQNFTPEDTSPILRPVETFEEAFHEFPGILDSIQQQAFSRPSPIQVHPTKEQTECKAVLGIRDI
jgi:hypothetical protein